jgi:phosphoribosylglycinamide formyltransferase-1
MKNIAIFASGNGSNAETIIRYFESRSDVSVRLVLSNNKNAKVLQRAANINVETFSFSREDFYNSHIISEILNQHNISLIVLAGFLWLIPDYLLKAFPNRIINIHPALLPKYGGKGMYGMHVHQSVIDNGELMSGITIHFVNDVYDEGKIIYQATCPVEPDETPETLAQKIHVLEHKFFPETIDSVLSAVL